MAQRVQVIGQAPRTQRVPRRPMHTFVVKHQPMVLQPFLLAPVLPGETLKNLLLQSRAVTDPIKNPLAGWWLEYYIFYVKHSDLTMLARSGGQTVAKELQDMMLQPTWASTDINATADSTFYYAYQGGINFAAYCHEVVVNNFFRDADETILTSGGLLNGQAMAHIRIPGWQASWRRKSVATAEDVALIDAAATADILYASEVEAAMRQYELLKAGGQTQQTYEEFLATYGVRVPREELHVPELIRYVREWSYPTNTIDPTTGTARSAVSWAIGERADKDRFFREPGFIYGVTCCRPKVYFTIQRGTAVGNLDAVYRWLPPVLADDRQSAFAKNVDAVGAGPFGAALTEDSEWDTRDLYLYGDQFIGGLNSTYLRDGLWNGVQLPTSTGENRYLQAADVSALFVTATTAEFVRQDGIVDLTILGSVQDVSHNVGLPRI